MLQWRLTAILAVMPTAVLAQSPNPFVPPAVNDERPAPINVFAPLSTHPVVRTSVRGVELPLPPLPPPPPVAAHSPSAAEGLRSSTDQQGGALKGSAPTHSCGIGTLPAVPDVAVSGGDVVLHIPEAAGRCIAGVEAQQDWLRIKFFNGRELHLEIDANPHGRERVAELVFASVTDSQLIKVHQTGAAAERGAP